MKDDAGLAHKVLKKVELTQREFDLVAVNRNLAATGRQRDALGGQRVAHFFGHTSAAKERAAAAGEFHEREGLGEVIVGAAVKGNNLIKLGYLLP